MPNRAIQLLIIFVLVFSFQGFSQTTEKSEHPLLDKYYPRASSDTNKTVTTQIKTEAKPAPAAVTVAPPPVVTPAAIAPPPVPTTTVNAVSASPAVTGAPGASATSVPAVTTTPGLTVTPPMTTTSAPAMTTESSATTLPTATTTSAVNKPVVTPQAPVQKVQTQPGAPLYSENRLGSSTPQYDTWEKNSNGAGSVTTRPK